MTQPFGLAINTYNRIDMFKGCLDAIFKYTTNKHQLIVVDDGSTDGTPEFAQERGIFTIAGANSGPAWNMNRALYFFYQYTDCDPIVILEDDSWPNKLSWEEPWLEASKQWLQVAFAHFVDHEGSIIGGAGIPASPYLANTCGTQCSVVTRKGLEEVGYLDTRFIRYGHYDTDWRWRFGRHTKTMNGRATLAMTQNIDVQQCKSNWNDEAVREMGTVLETIEQAVKAGVELDYRPAFRSDAEQLRLATEICKAGMLKRKPLRKEV